MDAAFYNGYQLIGDCHMIGFCINILQIQPKKNEQGIAQIDFCVSDQGVRQLHRRISRKNKYLADKIILCIGTNDIKNLFSFRNFKICVRTLKKALSGKEVIWLTIPPRSRYSNYPLPIMKLQQFNDAIRKCQGENIKVLDFYKFFTDPNNKELKEYYEKFYIRPRYSHYLQNKRDEINSNSSGLPRMALCLKENIDDESTTSNSEG